MGMGMGMGKGMGVGTDAAATGAEAIAMARRRMPHCRPDARAPPCAAVAAGIVALVVGAIVFAGRRAAVRHRRDRSRARRRPAAVRLTCGR
jgi:hypothetical protein